MRSERLEEADGKLAREVGRDPPEFHGWDRQLGGKTNAPAASHREAGDTCSRSPAKFMRVTLDRHPHRIQRSSYRDFGLRPEDCSTYSD